MSDSRRIQTRIALLKRLPSSVNGNPRFEVHTLAGVFKTKIDASCAYGIGNPEYQGDVVITLDGRGSIVAVEAA